MPRAVANREQNDTATGSDDAATCVRKAHVKALLQELTKADENNVRVNVWRGDGRQEQDHWLFVDVKETKHCEALGNAMRNATRHLQGETRGLDVLQRRVVANCHDGGTAIKDIGAKCAQDGLGACCRASQWKRRTGKTEGFLTFRDVAPALSPSLVTILLFFNLRQMSPVSPGSLALLLMVASLLGALAVHGGSGAVASITMTGFHAAARSTFSRLLDLFVLEPGLAVLVVVGSRVLHLLATALALEFAFNKEAATRGLPILREGAVSIGCLASGSSDISSVKEIFVDGTRKA
jgi:hypothetical protein